MLNNKGMWFTFELIAHFSYLLFNQVEIEKKNREKIKKLYII